MATDLRREEIDKLHTRAEAVNGQKYKDEDGNIYMGLESGRVRLLEQFSGDISGTVDNIKVESVGGVTASEIEEIAVANKTIESEATEISFTYTDFLAGATSKSVKLITLEPGYELQKIVTIPTTKWAGTGITAITSKLGTLADTERYTFSGFDLTQNVADTNFKVDKMWTMEDIGEGETQVYVTVTSTGANLSALTNGAVKFIVYMKKLI